MKNLWVDSDATQFGADPIGLRVYSSRLLGREPSLVLHGGGNTSVKASSVNAFGEAEELLYVKGSGWDLAAIEAQGFAPVNLNVLRRLAEMESLADSALVKIQRSALSDPSAPDPSIEAILHGIIPFSYVDHTHADAVVALTNSPEPLARLEEVFSDKVLVVPYVMPGFPLARLIYRLTREIDWSGYEGMILLSHGAFTWGNTARDSYEAMTRLVTKAEDYLTKRGAFSAVRRTACKSENLRTLSSIRRKISDIVGHPMIARLNSSDEACGFAELPELKNIASRGPLTPDHVIRTKRIPVIFGSDPISDLDEFAAEYRSYFDRWSTESQRMLDQAPRWAVWPEHGLVSFGRTRKECDIVSDICDHTILAIQWAEGLGGWQALPESDLFAIEYWELEQAKLGKQGAVRQFDGRVAVVTGAASGIGKAIVVEFLSQGAAVIAVDVAVGLLADSNERMVRIECDVTDAGAAQLVADAAVREFGGLDVLISNVGIVPQSENIEVADPEAWARTLDVNLTSHQRMLSACIPFLRNGINPSVVVVGSKNVPAPGPGQAAYSVSKAGLTQLARVAALELASDGIRVNVIHPNAVFDTAIWTDEMLKKRADAYGMTIDQYKRDNLLGVEIRASDVARLVAALAGPIFSCTTGAQIPIDGGNMRVV